MKIKTDVSLDRHEYWLVHQTAALTDKADLFVASETMDARGESTPYIESMKEAVYHLGVALGCKIAEIMPKDVDEEFAEDEKEDEK